MLRVLWRHLFAWMLMLSLLIHVGLLLWFSGSAEAMPELLGLQQGKCSLSLQASPTVSRPLPDLQVEDVEPLIVPDPPVVAQQPVEPLVSPPAIPEPPQPDLSALPELEVLSRLDQITKAVQAPAPRRVPRVEQEPIPEPKPVLPPKPVKQLVAKPSEEKPSTERKTPADQPAAQSSQASEGAEVDELPRYLFNPAPRYPPDALAAGLEGRVLLRVVVGADGRVVSAKVHRSSGVTSLDAAALEAVRRWRFVPARRGGVAVSKEVAVPVRFVLRRS